MMWKWDATQEEREGYRELMRKKAEGLFCHHEECEDQNKTGEGNIVFVRKYGKGERRISSSAKLVARHSPSGEVSLFLVSCWRRIRY